MRRSRRAIRFIRRCYRVLIIVVSVVVVTTLASTGVTARAAVAAPAVPSGDFSLTLSASDLGLSTTVMQKVVTEVQQQSAADGGLSNVLKREIEEFPIGGSTLDTSGWADFNDATLNMSSDGTGMVITIPAAEVQTSATWWQTMVAMVLGGLAGYGLRMLCIGGLTASGVGAGLIPLICTPLGGAIAGFTQGLIVHGIDGDLGSASAWVDIIVKTLVGAVGGALWEKYLSPFAKANLPGAFKNIGNWLIARAPGLGSWFGASASTAVESVGETWIEMELLLGPALQAADAAIPAAGSLSCDVYNWDGAPCAAAYSMDRALYAYYDGPLYQVQRASDSAMADIGLLATGGYVNAAAQDSFCASTSCTITKVYDQSPVWNDLTIEGAGGAAGADHGASATALPITVNGHEAYGLDITGQIGYRDNSTRGIAVNGQPEGMYMVASGTNVNSGCCFDFGNAETNTRDNGVGHMDAVNLTTWCGGNSTPCTGSGPWVEADMENGQWLGSGSNPADTGNSSDFVTAMLKNNGQTAFALEGGNSQSGGLAKYWDGALPSGYAPMRQEGAIVLGTGGDNSNSGIGSFFEGVMTQGYPSDAADNAAQAGIVSAGYAGNSGGVTPPPAATAASAAGPAVVHTGYSSVYTVDAANGHLQESYLPAMGDAWSTQDLSANYGTPPVMPGTKPVALVHCGFTSVYTVDAGSGDLQETYLPAMGDPWTTQDLSVNYGTPPTDVTPTAVVHAAGATGAAASCGFTSVYTVDERNGHLQETYLPLITDPWTTQDLSANYGTPQVQAGTSPVAIVHTGYTSVYTVDANHQLQETYLPAIGGPWSTQSLSANYGTPATTVTPTAVVHSGYTSVYTVDAASQHLQETYLPAMGDPWSTQDLSANYGTPQVAPGTQPEALVHTGYTSVYTVDQASDHLQETYLPAMGDPWSTQDLSAKYGTPATAETPVVLLHPDTSGALTWTSVYTLDEFSDHLRETYLPAIGDSWTSQDLSAKYGTPPDEATWFPTAGWSVVHDGYTSAYTVDVSNDHLQETYLTAMGKPWATQDLSANYGTPAVMPGAAAVSLTHAGYTSVYTIDKSNGHLQESYLTAIGQSWATQDLSAQFGTPAAKTTPAAVFHTGYTSVYTIDAATGHLWETYLPAIGGPWHAQDLSANYGTPAVGAGTSPVAIVHSGYTSVYTVDAANGHLQETYLPAIGDSWSTQDLSANYGTPAVGAGASPSAIVHSGYTSVYTVDAANGHLQETYLPAMGDSWSTQDLSANYGTPPVAAGMAPVALYHTGYASVYTIDQSNNHVQETYLPAISDAWSTQDLSASYGTPAANQPPSALVHDDTSGGLTWTSLYTVDLSNDHLQETYLPAMGDPWSTQDLSANYGTPPV